MQCPDCAFPNSSIAIRCGRCGGRLRSVTGIALLAVFVLGFALALLAILAAT